MATATTSAYPPRRLHATQKDWLHRSPSSSPPLLPSAHRRCAQAGQPRPCCLRANAFAVAVPLPPPPSPLWLIVVFFLPHCNWGGLWRERHISIFFVAKSPVGFAHARSAGVASDNKTTRGRLAEGCWLHVSPGRSRLPTRLKVWEGNLLAEAKKYHRACVVCTMLQGKEC